MKKIIISILVVLLTIFPDSAFLLSNYQNLTFLGDDAVTDIIIDAINNNDADTIEAMLSQHTKENGENLNSKIKELIATIDGDIIEYYDSGNGSDGAYSNNGVSIKDKSWAIYIKTDSDSEYLVCVSWVIVNTINPDKVGMKTIYLTDTHHNTLARIYIPID